MRNYKLHILFSIFILLIILVFFLILNISNNYSKNEKLIIDNFLEKIDNNSYKSKIEFTKLNGFKVIKKDIFFKKEDGIWYWSFDNDKWVTIDINVIDGLSLKGNNLKIKNELKKYSLIKENNNKYNYFTKNHGTFALKDIGNGKYDLMCLGLSCKQKDVFKKILKEEGIDFNNVKFIYSDSLDIYKQNILNFVYNKKKVGELLKLMDYTGYLSEDWDNNFTPFYNYGLSDQEFRYYKTEIDEIKNIKHDYSFIDFIIINDIFINHKTDKKSTFAFINGIICNKNAITSAGFIDISCIVVDNNAFQKSIKLLNKYFYIETKDNIKHYYYNSDFTDNYLTISKNENNKVNINVNIEYIPQEEKFISRRIELINKKNEIKKRFLSNIHEEVEPFNFKQIDLLNIEKYLTGKYDLILDRYYDGMKSYKMNDMFFNFLYSNLKSNAYGLSIKMNDFGNIKLDGKEYDLFVFYSTDKNEIFSFYGSYVYGYILHDKENKQLYIMNNNIY